MKKILVALVMSMLFSVMFVSAAGNDRESFMQKAADTAIKVAEKFIEKADSLLEDRFERGMITIEGDILLDPSQSTLEKAKEAYTGSNYIEARSLAKTAKKLAVNAIKESKLLSNKLDGCITEGSINECSDSSECCGDLVCLSGVCSVYGS